VSLQHNEDGDLTRLRGGPSIPTIDVDYRQDGTVSQIVTSSDRFSFDYDARGQLRSMRSQSGTDLFCGYVNGEVTRVEIRRGQAGGAYYLEDGLLVSCSDLLGGRYSFQYEQDKLHQSRQEGYGQADYTYDEKGRPRAVSLPNGSRTTYAYGEGELRITRHEQEVGEGKVDG